MVAKRGSGLKIKRTNSDSPETFTAIGDVQNATLNIGGNPIDITTGDNLDENDEIWQVFLTGPKNISVSANGISNAFLPIQTVYNDFATGASTNYQIVVPNVGTWEMTMIVSDMEFAGPYDGPAGFSLTLQASGNPTFTAET